MLTAQEMWTDLAHTVKEKGHATDQLWIGTEWTEEGLQIADVIARQTGTDQCLQIETGLC